MKLIFSFIRHVLTRFAKTFGCFFLIAGFGVAAALYGLRTPMIASARYQPSSLLTEHLKELQATYHEAQQIVMNLKGTADFPAEFAAASFKPHFPEHYYRDVSAAGLGSYDAPPKPKWTPDQAVKEARTWYENVLGEFPHNAGSPIAEYAPGLNPPKYYDGQWTVRWPRDDGHGHQFSQDTISVTLNEKYGVTSLANNFISKFPIDQKILVSKDQAVATGRLVAEKLLSSPLTADWSKGLSVLPASTAQLWVVNPNHLLRYKSLEELAAAPADNTARLAWVITYRASNGSMGRDMEVWIDTETKEVLGGDFK